MKVGVFDSGLGGLTVLNAIIKQLKGAEIFYIADTLYAPYGDKNKDEIFSRSEKITNFLLKNYEIDALVIACNTATSVAIKHLREVFPSLIIIGTEPGIKPAINNTKTKNIGILATASTLKGEKYQLLANELTTKNRLNKKYIYHSFFPHFLENKNTFSPPSRATTTHSMLSTIANPPATLYPELK